MAVVTKPEAHNQGALYEDLRLFLESNDHPEHAQIQQSIQKVEELKTRILGMANEGKISSEGAFPLDKIQEAKQCLSELQTELQKVFEIHQTVSTRWAMLKIGEGYSQEIIQPVVTVVLGGYQARWSNMG